MLVHQTAVSRGRHLVASSTSETLQRFQLQRRQGRHRASISPAVQAVSHSTSPTSMRGAIQNQCPHPGLQTLWYTPSLIAVHWPGLRCLLSRNNCQTLRRSAGLTGGNPLCSLGGFAGCCSFIVDSSPQLEWYYGLKVIHLVRIVLHYSMNRRTLNPLQGPSSSLKD